MLVLYLHHSEHALCSIKIFSTNLTPSFESHIHLFEFAELGSVTEISGFMRYGSVRAAGCCGSGRKHSVTPLSNRGHKMELTVPGDRRQSTYS